VFLWVIILYQLQGSGIDDEKDRINILWYGDNATENFNDRGYSVWRAKLLILTAQLDAQLIEDVPAEIVIYYIQGKNTLSTQKGFFIMQQPFIEIALYDWRTYHSPHVTDVISTFGDTKANSTSQ